MAYFPTETVSKYIYFRDKDDVLFDPDTYPVAIYEPDGSAVSSPPTLSPISTGKYELNWNVPADADRGDWVIEISATITAGSYKGIEKFIIEVEL